jgi:mono/diheme cytochrome c family protein
MTCTSLSGASFAGLRLLTIAAALAFAVALSRLAGNPTIGSEPSTVQAVADDREFARMRKVVEDHCLRCHGKDKSRGGLDLSTLHGWTRGGDSGPAILINDPDASATVRRAREGSMPPIGDGRALTAEELDAVVAWILDGAHWPDGIVLGSLRPYASVAQGCGAAPKLGESCRCRARIRRGCRSIW